MKMIRILILFLCTVLPATMFSQFHFTQGCQQAYELVFDLQFEQAKSILKKEEQKQATNLMVPLIENYMDFLAVFISEDENLFNQLQPKREQRLNRITLAPDDDPMKRLAMAGIQLQWAMVKLKFGQQVSAAWEIRRSFLLVSENMRLFPEHLPNRIAMGVLYSLVGSIPTNYQWIARLASMQGTVEEGSLMLQQAFNDCGISDSWKPLQSEVLFYLTYIEMNLRPDKSHAQNLLGYFPASEDLPHLLLYAQTNLLMHLGMNDEALILLNSRDNSKARIPLAFLDYMTGECYLRKLEPIEAAIYYRRFLNHFNGKNYRSDAIRKLAWTELLQGKNRSYKAEIIKISEAEIGLIDADKQALRELQSGKEPDKELLKARLLFDGGYYSRAAEHMLTLGLPEQMEIGRRVEYYYRFGRIRHEQKIIQEAIIFYGKTIDEGKSLPVFYAANSALKLGEIFESAGEKEKSEKYYQLCLQIMPDEYRTSIHLKAKAGLNRLRGPQ
jgi:tetratricopeptide (TPR) repeat protein